MVLVRHVLHNKYIRNGMIEMNATKWSFKITEIDEDGGYVHVVNNVRGKSEAVMFENIKAGVTVLLGGIVADYDEINLIYKKTNGYPKYLLDAIVEAIKKAYEEAHNVTLLSDGAKITSQDKEINFYYNSTCEGVIVDGIDYPFMVNVPHEYTAVINILISAFHKHRENVLKLDKLMKPLNHSYKTDVTDGGE